MEEQRGTGTSYTASLTKPFIGLISAIIAILVLIGIVPIFLVNTERSDLLMNLVYLVPVVAVLVFCILALFLKTVITLDDEYIHITNAGYFKKRISYHEIEDVRQGPDTSLSQGLGVRVMAGRRMGYLSGGSTVKFVLKDGAVVVASATNPDAVIDDIRTRMKSAQAREAQ